MFLTPRRVCIALSLLLLVFIPLSVSGAAPEKGELKTIVIDESRSDLPADFTIRARVTKITPSEDVDITWRHGGEGLGGKVTKGELGRGMRVGQWSEETPVAGLTKGSFPTRLFLTLETGRRGKSTSGKSKTDKEEFSTDVVMEIQFSYKGKAVKTLTGYGPKGGSITIVIPGGELVGETTPADSEFLEDFLTIRQYAERRAKMLEDLPWAQSAKPKRFFIVNNLGGYGYGVGRGVRTTDIETLRAEFRSLRQLGGNGVRGASGVLQEMIASGEGIAGQFARGAITHIMGYTVPRYRAGRTVTPDMGCPFHPTMKSKIDEGVRDSLQTAFSKPVEEVWALTVDEIGSAVNLSPQRKAHYAACEYCTKGFREFLRKQGLTPGDFGKSGWSEVRPLDLTGLFKGKSAEGEGTAEAETQGPETVTLAGLDRKSGLLAYYSDKFNNYATAHIFSALKDAFSAANKEKSRAIAEGKTDSPEAKRPWIYSYALRRNSFLMGGGFPDFFDYYRLSDNAFVYETSNRGARIWGWDSYLCDVGRVVSNEMDKRFGIYVKPHRGAPVQRGLSAASRGARMIYWYTYGPDYAKGDSFSQRPDALVLTSKAAYLLGKTEHVLYGCRWVHPAKVAVVNPRTSNAWMRLQGKPPRYVAAWENAKWIYSALTHAHVPVDPLDEVMLAEKDLSKYRIIYVSGPNITRAAGRALERYVREGGTLYTSGGGLARDEANQPLKPLQPVLGLTKRSDPEMYYTVSLYGATQIEPFDDSRRVITPVPSGAEVRGAGRYGGRFTPVVGREVLHPAKSAEVLARFTDGQAAMIRNRYGKGVAYTVGFFPGLEYSAPARGSGFDMTRDFTSERRSYVAGPALELVHPVVDASSPLVEGVLVQNDSGERAVTLMNWAYRVTGFRQRGKRVRAIIEHVPCENLTVTIREAGDVSKITSAVLGDVPFRTRDDAVTVTLPRLAEGDVLLLE